MCQRNIIITHPLILTPYILTPSNPEFAKGICQSSSISLSKSKSKMFGWFSWKQNQSTPTSKVDKNKSSPVKIKIDQIKAVKIGTYTNTTYRT